MVDACTTIACGPYAHCVEEKVPIQITGSTEFLDKVDAKCFCDPGFIPDPDPNTRCKKDCENGYQAVGPRCIGSVSLFIGYYL